MFWGVKSGLGNHLCFKAGALMRVSCAFRFIKAILLIKKRLRVIEKFGKEAAKTTCSPKEDSLF